MRLEPWWYSRAAPSTSDPLRQRTGADVVVIGGGIAGLHAALRVAAQGADVVLLEKSFCGGGMSGRSSGLLTPDSELSLYQLVQRFGLTDAARLWTTAAAGVTLMVDTAKVHEFRCDLHPLDSLFVGIGRQGVAAVRNEDEVRGTLGYRRQSYDAAALRSVHPGGYAAGVRYGETFAVDPFAYCQALRAVLLDQGVRVYENSEVRALDGTTVTTTQGSVDAASVVMCVNQIPRDLNPGAYRQYCTTQTCMAISRPLSAGEIASLFPEDRLQCWDSRLLYNYYRLTGDGRLLLGGGSVLTTMATQPMRTPRVIEAVIAGFIRRFPTLRGVKFEAYWPGLVDVTRDLLPIADALPESPSVHVIIGCVGLPWAAWCGDEVARRISGAANSEVASLFRWGRHGVVPQLFQRALGKPAGCAIDLLAAHAGIRRPD